jgi:hypothetical protein
MGLVKNTPNAVFYYPLGGSNFGKVYYNNLLSRKL